MEIKLDQEEPQPSKSTLLNAQQALEEMGRLTKEIDRAVQVAKEHADKYNLSFYASIDGEVGARYNAAVNDEYDSSSEGGWDSSACW